MPSRVLTAGAIVGGGMIGGAAVLVAQLLMARSRPLASTRPAAAINSASAAFVPPPSIVLSVGDDSALEQRVRAIEAAKNGATTPPEERTAERNEEIDARQSAEEADKLSHHQAEPRDPRWAAESSEAIRSELAAVSKKLRFNVESIDCRSQSCVSTMRWENYGEARQSLTKVLASTHNPPCARVIYMQVTDAPEKSYVGTEIWECNNEPPERR